jgi:hypothetical protein
MIPTLFSFGTTAVLELDDDEAVGSSGTAGVF